MTEIDPMPSVNRNACRLACLFLFACVSVSVSYAATPRGHDSPDALFAAYRDAVQSDDWRAVHALGSTRHQRFEQVTLLLICLPLAAEEATLRAQLEEQGLPCNCLRDLCEAVAESDAEAPNYEQQWEQLVLTGMRLIDQRVADPAGLYAAIRGYHTSVSSRAHSFEVTKRSGPVLDVVIRRSSVVEEETFAPAPPAGSVGPDGVETPSAVPVVSTNRKRLRRSRIYITETERFRQIEGRWYFGLSDEAIQAHDRLTAGE